MSQDDIGTYKQWGISKEYSTWEWNDQIVSFDLVWYIPYREPNEESQKCTLGEHFIYHNPWHYNGGLVSWGNTKIKDKKMIRYNCFDVENGHKGYLKSSSSISGLRKLTD